MERLLQAVDSLTRPVGPVGRGDVAGGGRPVVGEERLPGADFGLGEDVAFRVDVDFGVGLGAGGDDGVLEEEVAAEGVAGVRAVADGERFVGPDDAVGEGVLGKDPVAGLWPGFVHLVVGIASLSWAGAPLMSTVPQQEMGLASAK